MRKSCSGNSYVKGSEHVEVRVKDCLCNDVVLKLKLLVTGIVYFCKYICAYTL